MAGRLPVVLVRTHGDGKVERYFRDDRLNELRHVDNPHVRLDLYDLLLGVLAGVITFQVEGENGGN